MRASLRLHSPKVAFTQLDTILDTLTYSALGEYICDQKLLKRSVSLQQGLLPWTGVEQWNGFSLN